MNKNETDKKYQSKMDKLIKIMRNSGCLNDNQVELAIRKSPRHEFVPKSLLNMAYENIPISLMKNQTISQPSHKIILKIEFCIYSLFKNMSKFF